MSKVVNVLKFNWFSKYFRRIRILYLVVFVVIIAQIILSVILLMRLNDLNLSFLDYREASMKRINQIHGQVYSLSSRILENKK